MTTEPAAPRAFEPECLTLFVNNACNLACAYCHATPAATAGPPLSADTVAAAADIVAMSCARRGVTMTLALHGGGEPLLDRDEAARLLAIVRQRAEKAGVPLTTYVATNGVVPEETARWAAGAFDLIGLSCDGPPDVQDAQRPRRGGGASSAAVERTAAVLRERGARFHARATITSETLDRQPEVVAYLAEMVRPAEIRLEPAYANPGALAALRPGDAGTFVAGFRQARCDGAARDVPVTTSLLRPDEPHGPYCNVLRGVVNLVPGGTATGCFLESRPPEIAARRVRVGGPDGPGGRFTLDHARIAELAAVCARVPDECRGCAIEHACSRGCPDVCMLAPDPTGRLADTFRCRAQRLLAGEVALA